MAQVNLEIVSIIVSHKQGAVPTTKPDSAPLYCLQLAVLPFALQLHVLHHNVVDFTQ